jgi:hypothetical protein
VRDDIRNFAVRATGATLRASVDIAFLIRPGTGPDGYDVVIEPPADQVRPTVADPAPTPARIRRPETGRPWGSEWPPLRVDLAYAPDMRWTFELDGAESWIAVGRGVTDGGDILPPIRLPDFVVAVPRGRLLDIRYWHGEARWRRTNERSRYAIRVDKVQLRLGESCGATAAGQIEYIDPGGPRTLLTYSLTWRPVDDHHTE